MRKWCVECRRLVSLEQARERKVVCRQRIQQPRALRQMQPILKLKV
jgi:hypothetical protein